MKAITPLILAAACMCAGVAQAGPATEALSACFADNTTGKDRKEFARWIFIAMAAHPDIKGLANVNSPEKEAASRYLGETVTRLVSTSCAQQARAAVAQDGSEAFKGAFGTLGRLAMQELMSNQEVIGTMGSFENYIDKKKLQAAMSQM